MLQVQSSGRHACLWGQGILYACLEVLWIYDIKNYHVLFFKTVKDSGCGSVLNTWRTCVLQDYYQRSLSTAHLQDLCLSSHLCLLPVITEAMMEGRPCTSETGRLHGPWAARVANEEEISGNIKTICCCFYSGF